VIIEVRDLGVRFTFDRQGRPITTGAARLRRHTHARFGLRHVGFSVEPGEAVALIGPNGAGKTTLLRALAGVYEADEGEVVARGRVGPLLSVNGGLIPMLTGREACAHLAVLTGTHPGQVGAELDAIREVSELGDAFDDLVSSYSAGMQARLAFATITQRRPDLLLLDEVHQAFDSEFRATVAEEARRIRERGGCVLAAGHDSQALGRLCDRAIHLKDGQLVADGPFDEVAGAYESPLK
jgi:lipopolysaccharide transport system ATP-binding protein